MSATKWRETFAGRYADVEVEGVVYALAVTCGKRVRRMYSAKWGNHWQGSVRRRSDGADLWYGRVDKSTGAPTLLRLAGVAPSCAYSNGNPYDHKCCAAPAPESDLCKLHQPWVTR